VSSVPPLCSLWSTLHHRGHKEGTEGIEEFLLPLSKISNLIPLILGNHTMPAIETFDWFKNEIWPKANDDVKKFLEERRKYLLQIRNENERRRLIDEVMTDVKAVMMRQKT